MNLQHARYEFLEQLGQGGQGQVFRVRDREHQDRDLVAKIVEGSFRQEAVAQEFALLARLDVPGLVKASDLGWLGTKPFLVEARASGMSPEAFVDAAEDALERRRRFVLVFANVLEVLASLHDAGFVHGDLKPEHLRVGVDGAVTVLDLGAAVLRSRSLSSYTKAFAAPEVLAYGQASARSDLFSLARTMAYVAARTLTARSIRRSASWLREPEHALLDQCLSEHPYDRPADAEAALRVLERGRALKGAARFVGRADELDRCKTEPSSVLYVIGAGGVGKTRLLREASAQALLAGKAVRAFTFPEGDQETRTCMGKLAAYFRGDEDAWPFLAPPSRSTVIILDGMQHAGPDVSNALDVYRCSGSTGPAVLVGSASAPPGAARLILEKLSDDELRSALHDAGSIAKLDEALRAAQGNPGILFGLLGMGRASPEAILEGAKRLSGSARDVLAALSLSGGSLVRDLGLNQFEEGAFELAAGGFVHLQGPRFVLSHLALAPTIAETLGSVSLAETCAQALLSHTEADADAMVSLALGPHMPSQRSALLTAAIAVFVTSGERTREHNALTHLLADAKTRAPSLLVRYERLSRELGSPLHREALNWLTEAAKHFPEVHTLAERRATEALARAGEHQAATAKLAALLAVDAGALVQSTRAMLALLRADWKEAERALEQAVTQLAEVTDEEELARIEHNRGIVLLYRGKYAQAADAMRLSAWRKKRLGDRAGVRASLLNLGLAETKLGNFDAAFTSLDEACALARTLGQGPGLVWCLAAKTEAELRAGLLDKADDTLSQTDAWVDVTPAVVQTDLRLLGCELLIARGSGTEALNLLKDVPEALDTLTQAKVHELAARAHMACIPCDRFVAGKSAICSIRKAREGSHTEAETRACELLRDIRRSRKMNTVYTQAKVVPMNTSTDVLLPLAALALGSDRFGVFLKALLVATKSERAFLCSISDDALLQEAYGMDREGFSLPNAKERVDARVLSTAIQKRGMLYQRSVDFEGECGSRVCLAAGEPRAGLPRAVLVLEHRFREGAFDALADAESLLRQYAALAQLVLHVETASQSRSSQVESSHAGSPLSLPSASYEAPLTTWTSSDQRHRAFPGIVGESAALSRALFKLDLAADSMLPVLLTGETGVGKELFARAIHETGARREKPFVAVNCGAIADSLFESELFGHVRGAFTGADKERGGLLAKAEGGTLFLDEIGELPLARQASLLRTLESKKVRPVGSDHERAFDVRIVCATNRNLDLQVVKGLFREDLLFRINVVPIVIPPLRDRKDDIPLLVQAICKSRGLTVEFSDEAFACVCHHDYPGNVRELTHLLERLSLHRDVIEAKQLPRELRRGVHIPSITPRKPAEATNERVQKREIAHALTQSHGNITHAAAALGITRHGLKKRMLRLGLREKS
jgi:serine/threonine-protein kinase PknK